MAVSNKRSDMMGALHNCGTRERDISINHIPVMLRVLAKVVQVQHSNDILNNFLQVLLSTPFFSSRVPKIVNQEMMQTIIQRKWIPGVALECLTNLMSVIDACYERMPNIAYEKLHLVVTGLNTLLTQLRSQPEIEVPQELDDLHQVSSFQSSQSLDFIC